jgi:hypothetical protein
VELTEELGYGALFGHAATVTLCRLAELTAVPGTTVFRDLEIAHFNFKTVITRLIENEALQAYFGGGALR